MGPGAMDRHPWRPAAGTAFLAVSFGASALCVLRKRRRRDSVESAVPVPSLDAAAVAGLPAEETAEEAPDSALNLEDARLFWLLAAWRRCFGAGLPEVVEDSVVSFLDEVLGW